MSQVAHHPFASAAAASLLVFLVFVPAAQAECPRPMNDCGITIPLPPSSGRGNSIELAVGVYNLVANTSLGAGGDEASKGDTGGVTLRVYSKSQSAAPVTITIDIAGAVGVNWTRIEGQTNDTRTFRFAFDPATGLEPTGTFPFEVDGSGDTIVLPVRFAVQESAGPLQERAGFLTMDVDQDGGSSWMSAWLVPSLAGLVVGALLSFALLRRKTR